MKGWNTTSSTLTHASFEVSYTPKNVASERKGLLPVVTYQQVGVVYSRFRPNIRKETKGLGYQVAE